jgi:DNA sulfur modification protein DndD
LLAQAELPNYSLSREWPQLVEALIPLEFSQLFFFEGEKIRSLAEDASSSETTGAAIKALLGLDIVERLISDAVVLQTRLAKKAGTPEHRAEVEELENQVAHSEQQVRHLHAERSALQNQLERAVNAQKEAEESFAAAGGKHWNDRKVYRERRTQLQAIQEQLEAQIVAVAAGELPLALVPDLLEAIRDQDQAETQAAEAQIVQQLLTQRDRQLLEILGETRMPPHFLQLVAEHLERDRQSRQPAGLPARRLGLS